MFALNFIEFILYFKNLELNFENFKIKCKDVARGWFL